jgi:RNA-directed DNA polymerase
MDLRSDKRQKTQRERDSLSTDAGEAQRPRQREFESLPAVHEGERPTDTERMMEEICEWKNLKKAISQVKTNKG